MSYSRLDNSEIKLLIDTAFEVASIKGKGINNCKELSNKIEDTTGHKVSATTIYRVLNIHKYNVRPYEFTVESIDKFINSKAYNTSRKQYFDYEEHISDKINKPLTDLLRLALEDHNLATIQRFLDTLPSNYGALGFKQLDIAYVFASFFRQHQKNKAAMRLLDALSQHPKFTLYYFESFPDFDHSDLFYFDALKKNIYTFKYQQHLKKANANRSLTKDTKLRQGIYCISIFINMAYMDGKQDEIKNLGHNIFDNDKLREKLQNIASQDRILYSRFLFAYIQYVKTTLKEPEKKIAQTLDHWKSVYIKNRQSFFQKIFGAVIIADALISIGRSLEELKFVFTNKRLVLVAKQEFEPVHTRFLEYARLETGLSLTSLYTKEEHKYKLGFYELDHHTKMVELAKRLYSS